MRVAAVDCGTNSLRLLIADVTGQVLTEVDRRMEVVRLGEGVDRTGRIADKALARAGEAAGEYAGVMRDHGVENARMVATSATRDASNAEVFVEQMQDILGLTPQVISGEEEAEL
ncbi:MAG: exopolyphosphatase, partial [Micrococcales bacterium]